MEPSSSAANASRKSSAKSGVSRKKTANSTTSSHVKAKLHQCKLQLEHDLRLMDLNYNSTLKSNKAETRAVLAFYQNLRKHSGNKEPTTPPNDYSSRGKEDKNKAEIQYRCNPKMEFGLNDYHLGLTSRIARSHYCRSHFDTNYVIECHLKRKKLAWPKTT